MNSIVIGHSYSNNLHKSSCSTLLSFYKNNF